MKRYYYLHIFYLLIFISIICQGQKTDIPITDNHFNIDIENNDSVFIKVCSFNKSVLPILIEKIGIKKKSRVGFHDPSSSSFYEFSQNNYFGIKAAYLIEYYLSYDVNNINNDSTIVEYFMRPYNIFGYGIIVKQGKGNPVKEPLTYDDIKRIKELYKNWWIKNKDKSINELRKEWHQGIRVLNNTGYMWI